MAVFRSIFLLLLGIVLNASVIELYKEKKYSRVCKFDKIVKYKKNEKILSIIGDACVKTNKLYLLPYIVNYLKHTRIGRQNAIYFLVIFNEKKLLYAFLFDNFDINGFCFPKTTHMLSIIFEAIKNKKYEKIDNYYLIKNKDTIYKMYKEEDKMIIEEIKENNIKRCWFR
jgi:hypothetical protein